MQDHLKLIGATVRNAAYGTGRISGFPEKKDGKTYVSVLFDSCGEKSFQAGLAFSKKILVFDDPELEDALELFPGLQEGTVNDAVSLSDAKKTYEITSNSIVNTLIGRILNNEQIAAELIPFYGNEAFEKELCSEAFRFLEQIMTGGKLGKAYRACIVAALTLIAQKYYDGDLHSHIERKFREYRPKTESSFPRSSIQNGVYDAIRDYRERVRYFDPRSFVAVPIVLSCVPHYRVRDLFKISYGIYKQKLLFDEDVNDEQIREKVFETLSALRRKDLVSDSETIAGSSYLMSKYTQSCIYSGYGLEPLSLIITRCVRLIISHLTRPEDSFSVPPYYAEGYAAWTQSFEQDLNEKTRFENYRLVSQPYVRLVQVGDRYEVHLFTGKYSMDDSYDPNDVYICLYNGERLLGRHHLTDPNAIEFMDEDSAMSGYLINRQEFFVPDSPLDELSYTIESSGQTIYRSKNRLFRANFFFDEKGNEIKPGSNYSGELFVLTHGIDEDDNENLTVLSRQDGYVVSTAQIDGQKVYHFDGEPYVFYKIQSAQMTGYEVPWAEFVSFEGKKFPVYRHAVILFPASCEPEDIVLVIDGLQYCYGEEADVSFSVRLYSKELDGSRSYSVKIFNLSAGFHSVKIINAVSGKQIRGASFQFVYDNELKRQMLFKNDSGVTYELTGDITGAQELAFAYGMPKAELQTFVKNLGHSTLVLYPSLFSYSIDGEAWFLLGRKLLLCDIPESVLSLQICGPKDVSAYYLDPDGPVKRQQLSFVTDQDCPNFYRLFLQFFRSLSNKKNAVISLEYGSHAMPVSLRFNPFVLRDQCRFYYDELTKQHVFEIFFEGSGELNVQIKHLDSDSVLLSAPIYSGGKLTIDDSLLVSDPTPLSVSLFGRKYGSLFDRFQPEPFYTFPKYEIAKPIARIIGKPAISILGAKLSFKVDFEGTPVIMAKIIPNGFSTPVYSDEIRSGSTVSLDLAKLPFNSYQLHLYCADMRDKSRYSEKPFFISKSAKKESPFLQKTLFLSSFILEDKTKTNAPYLIRFHSIEEENREYYMTATLFPKSKGEKIENLRVNILSASAKEYVIKIRIRIGDKLAKLRNVGGKTIQGAVIDKFGGLY